MCLVSDSRFHTPVTSIVFYWKYAAYVRVDTVVYRYEIKIWGCSILQPDLDNCLFALQVCWQKLKCNVNIHFKGAQKNSGDYECKVCDGRSTLLALTQVGHWTVSGWTQLPLSICAAWHQKSKMYPIGKWPPPPILPFVPVVSIVDSRMQIGELGELLPVDKTALVQVFISRRFKMST